MSNRRGRTSVRLGVIVGVLLSAARPSLCQCTSGSSVSQWRCWEQTIVSSVDFYAGGTGNPYKDLTLRVTLNGPQVITQDAFWVADTANPKNFKVRAALPPGTWTWSVAGCTGTTPPVGGKNCASGVTWTPSSGSITVTSSSAGPQIFTRGFPTQLGYVTGGGTSGWTNILYGDHVTPYYWSADTAWGATGLEASGQANHWGTATTSGTYLYDRSTKGFNVALVAPAATYQAWPWSVGTLPFLSSCTSSAPVPNDCSRPNPPYWNAFDTLMSNANQAGIVPLIAGLVDPLDTASNGSYPCQANAVAFSRFLAARMSGFAVFYSPGFDDKVNATTSSSCPVNPGAQLLQVMNAVGPAVKAAAPNYLITNHLNGRATCTDYQNFRSSNWMTLFMFQSSHGIGLPTSPDPTGTICPRAQDSSETMVQASLRRSWQMAWTLTSSAASPPLPSYNPALPSYNAEGPYDNICEQTAGCTCPTGSPAWCVPNSAFSPTGNYSGANNVDVRYHNRQAAFESMFSGAYGFTYGAQEIAHWYFNSIPFSTALNGPAVGDMRSVFQNFNTRAGLTARRTWITNNGADTADDGNYKKALASDGSSLVLAYLPAGPTTGNPATISISTTNMPTLTCPNATWTYTWWHAQDDRQYTARAPQCTGTNPIAVTRPDVLDSSACGVQPYDNQACDWILQIQKTGAASPQTQLAPSAKRLDVWADLSPADGTSAIEASLDGPPNAPLVVSPAGLAFQQSPHVTRLRDGYLVVWHADSLDGSLLGVFAQVLDRNGQPVGNRIQVNLTTEQDQRDPAVDSDPLGNTVVVWESYGQDGDLGGIYARLFDSSGSPINGEIPVNAVTAGHQELPQVAYLPGGSFVVAWQTRPIGSVPGALSFRVFSGSGQPLTGEIQLPGLPGATSRLLDAVGTPTGTVRLRWGLDNPDGTTLGLWMQEFNSAGVAVGPATPLS